MRKANPALFLLGLLLSLIPGCAESGTVDQGRTVAFDKTSRTVTIVPDASSDPAHPQYDRLPAMTFRLPADPRDMGPEPKPGRRLQLEVEQAQIRLYNPATQAIDTIPIRIAARQEGVAATDPRIKATRLPAVEPATGVVTIYDDGNNRLVSFLPPEQFRALPAEDWAAGDVVRIFSKEPGTALRLMNVTRTDIFRK